MPEKELTPITGDFEIPVDQETYDSQRVGSIYVDTPGDYRVEMGMPAWFDLGRSIAFPFVITEDGEQKGKEDRLVAGISAEAFWKIKELAKACGVDYKLVKDKKTGKEAIKFNPADFAGKACIIRYLNETVDSTKRPGEKMTFCKAKSARAIKSVVEETN